MLNKPVNLTRSCWRFKVLACCFEARRLSRASSIGRSAAEVFVREISSSELTAADIPSPQADWDCMSEFALTFNGYNHWGSFEKCAEIANAERHGSLDDLRTCLFFEQRRWRHYGDDPGDEALAHFRDIVAKIRIIVSRSNRAIT